jgi:hypothetical protein
MACVSMAALHDEILLHILQATAAAPRVPGVWSTRIATTNLLMLRRVCRRWRALLTEVSPSIVSISAHGLLHANRHPAPIVSLVRTQKLCVIQGDNRLQTGEATRSRVLQRPRPCCSVPRQPLQEEQVLRKLGSLSLLGASCPQIFAPLATAEQHTGSGFVPRRFEDRLHVTRALHTLSIVGGHIWSRRDAWQALVPLHGCLKRIMLKQIVLHAIDSLGPLSGFTLLRCLVLDNVIRGSELFRHTLHLDALRALTRLRFLTLANLPFGLSLRPLARLPLRFLRIDNCGVDRLDPLEKCVLGGLCHIDLWHCAMLWNLAPLVGLAESLAAKHLSEGPLPVVTVKHCPQLAAVRSHWEGVFGPVLVMDPVETDAGTDGDDDDDRGEPEMDETSETDKSSSQEQSRATSEDSDE